MTAVTVGGATITATSEGKSGTSSITVVPVPVASVTVSLSPNSITAVGMSQAAATMLDGTGGTLTGRVVTWSSSNTAVATISAQGVVSAIAEGTANIIATSEGKIGSGVLTVTPALVATVVVSPVECNRVPKRHRAADRGVEGPQNRVLPGSYRRLVFQQSHGRYSFDEWFGDGSRRHHGNGDHHRDERRSGRYLVNHGVAGSRGERQRRADSEHNPASIRMPQQVRRFETRPTTC